MKSKKSGGRNRRPAKPAADHPQPQTTQKKTSIAEQALNAICKLIAEKELPGGNLVSEQEIIDKLKNTGLSVSRMPVRTALTQLAVDGVVKVLPQKGTSIVQPTNKELRQIWDSRVALEELAVVRLAERREELDLSELKQIHERMKTLAGDKEYERSRPDEEYEFLLLDEEFHSKLASLAGYDATAMELRSLRRRLLVVAPLEEMAYKGRLREVVREHGCIIEALEPSQESINPKYPKRWHRPDINAVRLALRTHLRNVASQWWRIEQRIRFDQSIYGRDALFDVPQLDPSQPPDDKESALLVHLRFVLELTAVYRLASRTSVNLSPLRNLQNEMEDIERHYPAAKRLPAEDQAKFVNSDISFHAGLCFLSGMLFAEEAILFIWRQLFEQTQHEITKDNRLHSIVHEHSEILHWISEGDKDRAIEATKSHLIGGFEDNGFNHRAKLWQAMEAVNEQVRKVADEKYWTHCARQRDRQTLA